MTSALFSKIFIYFFSKHEFPLLHGAPTHDVKPVAKILSKVAFDVLHGGKVLVARVVCTTRDLHIDVDLELGLILVLSLCLQLAMLLCFLLRVLIPAVGCALCTCSFTRCGSALLYLDLLTPRRHWFVLLWTPRLTCLSGPVSGPPLLASPLASAELTLPVQCEALVTSKTWLFTC